MTNLNSLYWVAVENYIYNSIHLVLVQLSYCYSDWMRQRGWLWRLPLLWLQCGRRAIRHLPLQRLQCHSMEPFRRRLHLLRIHTRDAEDYLTRTLLSNNQGYEGQTVLANDGEGHWHELFLQWTDGHLDWQWLTNPSLFWRQSLGGGIWARERPRMNRRDMHGHKKRHPSWDPEGFVLVIARIKTVKWNAPLVYA